jgi:SAM-dependent methyltransferase
MEPSPAPARAAAATSSLVTDDAVRMDDAATVAAVKQYYGEQLSGTHDLQAAACIVSGAPPARLRALLAAVPSEVSDKFYGCGSPLPLGMTGLRVLDLGSGSGRDCYVAAALVGPRGHVTGVDMTPQLLAVARKHADAWARHLGYERSNMDFHEGRIEALADAGIAGACAHLCASLSLRHLRARARDASNVFFPTRRARAPARACRWLRGPGHQQLRGEPVARQARRAVRGVPRAGGRRRAPLQRRLLRPPPARRSASRRAAGERVPGGARTENGRLSHRWWSGICNA